MKEFKFDFVGKKTENDFAEHFYRSLNELTGLPLLVLPSIHPDGLYDDLFGFLSSKEFIGKFGKDIYFVLQNTNELKQEEPKVLENTLLALEETKKELKENQYLKKDEKTINFNYSIEN
ncbi:MAG: hypothetical protein U0522_03420 [Candidatus Paceibacterota bacterium]